MTREQFKILTKSITASFDESKLSNTLEPHEYSKFKAQVNNGTLQVDRHIKQQMAIIDKMVESPDYWVDPNAIDHFLKFVNQEMALVDGTPANNKVTPSFKLWAEDVLAWYQKVEHLEVDPLTNKSVKKQKFERVRKTQALIVGRGNAKSLYMSWMAAYLLITDPHTIDIVAAADTIDHAELILDPIRTVIASPVGSMLRFMSTRWQDKSQVIDPQLATYSDGVRNTVTGSKVRTTPMTNAAFQSIRPNLVLLDEIHQVREDVVKSAQESVAKTTGGLVIITTSEGTIRDGIFDNLKIYWEKILKGDVWDPAISIWWYMLDSREEVQDPSAWIKANPNLGITVQPATLAHDIEQMKVHLEDIPNTLAHRFGLSVQASTQFFTTDQVKKTPDVPEYQGEPAVMGVDLSQRNDLTSFVIMWKSNVTGQFVTVSRNYTPLEVYKRLPPIYKQKYDQAANENSLLTIKGSINDMRVIVEDLVAFINTNNFDIQGVGYDYAYSAQWLELYQDAMGDRNMKKIFQGSATLSAPMQEIRQLMDNNEMVHNQDILEWALSNMQAITDVYGNVKPNKSRNLDKIDPAAALIDAYIAYNDFIVYG